ncbi:MAG TPA: dUTP diphosphatase [Nitrospinota bacterium]|nr:dUTP diphosphatase [Nitrospinota bacterium]|tara:strand:- start:36618 stop:37049 length:432 start_codon:yes stop_codon:yes gene_type:complete
MDTLKIKKLDPSAECPQKANEGDLGYDLFALKTTSIPNGTTKLVGTGIAIQFPVGWGGVIKDRSSIAMQGIFISAGVIDSGYRGEVQILITNHSGSTFLIEHKHKIAQLVPIPTTDWSLEVVDLLDDSDRDSDGFGSTGPYKK